MSTSRLILSTFSSKFGLGRSNIVGRSLSYLQNDIKKNQRMVAKVKDKIQNIL